MATSFLKCFSGSASLDASWKSFKFFSIPLLQPELANQIPSSHEKKYRVNSFFDIKE